MHFPFSYWSNASRGGYGGPSGVTPSGSNYCNYTGATMIGTFANPFQVNNFVNEYGSTYVAQSGSYVSNVQPFTNLLASGPTSGDATVMWTPQIISIIALIPADCMYFQQGIYLYRIALTQCYAGECEYNVISQGSIFGIWSEGLRFLSLVQNSQSSGTITLRVGVAWPYWQAFTLNFRLVDGAVTINQNANQGPLVLPAYYQYNGSSFQFTFNAVVTAGTYLLEYQMILPGGSLGPWTSTGLTIGLSVF